MTEEARLDVPALLGFLEAEFRSQFRSVIDQITLPIPRRVDQFTCWPGLVVRDAAEGGRSLTLTFRTNPSKLRVGEYVYVNRLTVEPKDVISGPEGVIREIDEEARTVRIEPAYQQGQRFVGRFRLDDRVVLDQTLPGTHTGLDMPGLALRALDGEFGRHPRVDRVRALLEGRERARPTADRPVDFAADPALERLSSAQREAVTRAVETDFALIQGPPGTGKTFVLGLVIRELVARGLTVGVCAFTHQAINNVLLECLRHRAIPEVCKIGSCVGLEDALAGERLRAVARPAAFFRQRTTPAVTGFTQHAAFNPVARALDAGLDGALPSRFDVVVFDEAGQLGLPGAVMAMLQADRFVFAGDHAQLPPLVTTVRSGEGPGMSVFQHLVERAGNAPVLLDLSFRLNDELVRFPSEAFYGGALRAAASAAPRRLEAAFAGPRAAVLDPALPSTLALVRHEGRGQESPEEAALIAMLVDDALAAGVPAEEIAVIAPHRRQNVKIRELLARLGHTRSHPLVDTVERIQGQERDLVILGMTLSDPDVISAECDFLFLPNRFNVALTRARRKLVVVASPLIFRAVPSKQALHAPGPSPLGAVNVLKRWYFRHKAGAIDATEMARAALERFEDADGSGPTSP